MSRALMWKIALCSLFGMAIGLVGTALYFSNVEDTPKSGRHLAGAGGAKPFMMGKQMTLVQVNLRAPEGIADQDTQETTLVGWIRLNQALPGADLHFKWELPEGVQVVEGVVEDSWAGLQSGQVSETRLTVTGFSKESLKLVALHGFLKSGTSEVGNSAVITSRPEDSYEMVNSSGLATGFQKTTNKERAPLKGRILR
ncbi:MAG: hypothetical protein KF802_08480 [Bdellovibrionaceae bacterium]|nr:hypothetical protein [Pseudobdellovibrionaceae bacterium]MBX3034083.1 hypothetical protein [Pseudobdellovibrionaceae bacterium]